MNLAHRDLFELWRLLLGTTCTIYAGIVTLRSLWAVLLALSGEEKLVSMGRRYLVIQLLRLRFRRFSGELAGIGLWLVLLVIGLRWNAY